MKKKNILISLVLLFITLFYIYIVKNVDVQAIGPENSNVGLATINKFFMDLFKYNKTLYNLTEFLGIIPFVMVGFFGMTGLIELIRRKNIFKVDREIIALGVFYVIVIGIYVLFEKIELNFRPVLIDGVLEASFPSSHTVLAITISMSTIMTFKRIFDDEIYRKVVNIISIITMISITLGRFISGVHWFSDIVGGILISITLLYMLKTVLDSKLMIIKNK